MWGPPSAYRRRRRRSLSLVAHLLTISHARALTTKQPTTDRDALKVTQRPYDGVPLALQLELLLGAVLALVGGCALAGRLKPIVSDKGAP